MIVVMIVVNALGFGIVVIVVTIGFHIVIRDNYCCDIAIDNTVIVAILIP